MSTYATVEDLKAVLPARDLALLTDFEGAATEADDAKLEQALKDASAEINAYIAKVVDLPLQDPPDMLRVCCRDLAVYRLYANIGRHDAQEKLRDGAISYLESVGKGETSIGTVAAAIESSSGVVTTDGPDRVMTRETLKGF